MNVHTLFRAVLGAALCFALFLTPAFAAAPNSPARRTAVDESKAEAATMLEKGKADQA